MCIVRMYDSLLHRRTRNPHMSRYPSRCTLPEYGSYCWCRRSRHKSRCRGISKAVFPGHHSSRLLRHSHNPHKNPCRGMCIVRMYDSLLHRHTRNPHKSRCPSRCTLPEYGSYCWCRCSRHKSRCLGISRAVAQARRNSRQPRHSYNPHKNPCRGMCIL